MKSIKGKSESTMRGVHCNKKLQKKAIIGQH